MIHSTLYLQIFEQHNLGDSGSEKKGIEEVALKTEVGERIESRKLGGYLGNSEVIILEKEFAHQITRSNF